MDYMVEGLVILAMLLVNAVFAAYEMALASVSRARLEVLLQARRRGAASAAHMKDRMEGSLAVIQLGITLAGTVAAATGGAAVEEGIAPRLMEAWAVSSGTAEFLALVLFVIPLSAATIVFAELVPKMIGIENKEGVVLALSPVMRVVAIVFHPVVFVFETTVKRLLRLGRGRASAADKGGDRAGLLELRAAAALARAARIIGPMEERIVMSAVQMSERTAGDAMLPAGDIAMINASASLADALIEAHMNMRTRYPVCREPGDPQSITGYITFKDIISALKTGRSGSALTGIVRPIRRIPARTTLAQTLTDMIQEQIHIALVTDSDHVTGLITLEDIVRELVGDLKDEYDRLPTHLSPIGDAWLAGGGVSLASLSKAMGIMVGKDSDAKLTLAEWVERACETPPRSGDVRELDGLTVLLRKVRRNRVSEAVVRRGVSG